jgi:CobQ-like glutamine amidotransferase family enzyme
MLDVYTVGGGEDVAQILAADHLIADGAMARAVRSGRPVLAICAGLQVFGTSFRASGPDGRRSRTARRHHILAAEPHDRRSAL